MNEPLTTVQELATWTQQEEIVDDLAFAELILGAVAVVIRDAGSIYWTHDSIPPQAKVIADLVAKNFYEHPIGEKNETVGPLNSGYIDAVLQQVTLTDAQKMKLAELAGDEVDDEPEVVGLWALSIDPGPLHHQERRQRFITVPYWRPTSKPIAYYAPGALGSPE
jgi:hypothetical protein